MTKFISLFHTLIKVIFFKKFNMVFYSESKVYQSLFYSIIKNIKKKDSVIYLASDFDDKINILGVQNYYIGKGYFRNFIFLVLRSKLIIMTTSDLGNNEIKKTENIDHYIYFFHSLMSAHKTYTEFAFDNYDVIFCNGEYQEKELRSLEVINKSKKKKIINTGYVYFDFLRKLIDLNKKPDYILIAPSWNYSKDNFFEKNCYDLINELLKKNFKVILRPHLEHFSRSKKIIKKIRDNFSSNKNFSFDDNPSNINSMDLSEIIITDCSGIALEFLFMYKRPVIYMDQYQKIHNQNFTEMKIPAFEDLVKDEFGYIINSADIKTIDSKMFEAKKIFENKKNNINIFIDKNLYNFENASYALSKSLEKILI